MKRRSFALAVMIACAVASAPSFARAAGGAPAATNANDPAAQVRARIAAGEKRYADQEYRACIETFRAVLADPVSTRDERARAYEYIGLSWLILGNRGRAREAFEDLLSIDPHYALTDPSNSPKLREFFDQVRARFVPGYGQGAAGEVELEHAMPSGAVAGRALEVAVTATRGAPLVSEVALAERRQGLLTFTSHRLRPAADRSGGGEGKWTLSFVLPRDPNDYTLEYYLEARDAQGRVLARVASPEQPIALPVKGAPAAPLVWYKRWYVWAGVGAVVAGVAIGAAVAATAEHAPDGTLPPGKITLGLRF